MEFADENTLVSPVAWKTMVWNVTTGEEKTEALPAPGCNFGNFALSKQGDKVGRFVCTTDGDLLLIHLLADVKDDKDGGDKAAKVRRAPVAFFRAPSYIWVLDCQGADIALGLDSGAVLLLRAAVLLT